MKTFLKYFLCVCIFVFAFGYITASLQAETEALDAEENAISEAELELRKSIEEKAKNLEEINRQIEENQQNLVKTGAERNTLEKAIKTYNYRIQQLDLGIKGGQLKITVLADQITALRESIREKEEMLAVKQESIKNFIRELDDRSHENTLMIFLKHASLADSVAEMQSMITLNDDLTQNIQSLEQLKTELSDSLDQVSGKKKASEEENRSLQVKKVLASEEKKEKAVFLSQTKNKEQVYQQTLKELEKQQQAVSDEIEQIEDTLRKQFNAGLLPSPHKIFIWPVKLKKDGGVGILTQHFGERSSLYRGKPHNGVDIGVPIGTPVYAADDGTVFAVDNNGKYQYGRYVLIEHENKLTTIYAHLSKTSVTKGTSVKKGDVIGYSGNTGYSTGPHLHFGAYWASSVVLKSIPPASGVVPVGVIVSPEDYL